MRVTENMILNIVSQYPQGINGYIPTFDELLDIDGGYQGGSSDQQRISAGGGQEISQFSMTIMGIVFVILKFFLGWGWIISFILAFLACGVAVMLMEKFR